jgi:hypothetical protein
VRVRQWPSIIFDSLYIARSRSHANPETNDFDLTAVRRPLRKR